MNENLTLQLSKTIRASRHRAFEAWTCPDTLMKWFAPGAMQATAIHVDLRIGGSFRWAMQGPSPRTGEPMDIVFTGVFQEIVADQLLKFTWQSEREPSDSTVVTVAFTDTDGGTEVLLTHERIGSYDVFNRNKMGWASMLEKLSTLLEPAVAEVG